MSRTLTLTRPTPITLARIFYFCFFTAVGCLAPYLNVYFGEIGLTGSQIGFLSSLTPLMTLFSAALWSGLTDRLRIHRLVLSLALAGVALWATALSQFTAFTWIVPVMLGYAFFAAPIQPLMDSGTMVMLGRQRERYGQQRVWGSVGFVVGAWGMGWIVQHTSLHWLFVGYVGMILLCLVISLHFPARPSALTTPLGQGLRRLLKRRSWIFFLISVFLMGVTLAGMHYFLGLYLVALGGNESLIGLAWGLGALTELPVMFFSAVLLRRLTVRGTLALGFALYGLRWFLYALMRDPMWVIPINLLHGLSFASVWVAGVAYVDMHAPPGLEATAQGLFTSVLWGLSAASGALISGYLFDTIGPAAMFGVYGVVAGLALALFIYGSARSTTDEPH